MAATDFRDLTVNFYIETKIKKSDMEDKNTFYKVYSPITFKLKPREDIYLDLKFNIQTPETIDPWLNLLPSLKELGLSVEEDWREQKLTNNIILLHVLNKNFNQTQTIKKKQCIGFIFLLGEHCTDKITNKYTTTTTI